MNINDLLAGTTPENLLNALPSPCLCLDALGSPVACNDAMALLLRTEEKASVLACFDDPLLRKNIIENTAEFNYSCQKPTGETLHLKVSVKRIKPGGMFILTASEMGELEIKSELMLNASPLLISFFDSEMNNLECSMSAAEMFGLSSPEEYRRNMFYMMPPIQPNGRSSRQLSKEKLQEAFEKGRVSFEVTRQRADGTLMPHEVTFVRVEYKNEPHVVGFSRDLTGKIAGMERVKAAQQMAQIFMDTAPVGIELWNDRMEIIDCNFQVVELFGFMDKGTFMRRVRDVWDEHISPVFFANALENGFARYEWDFRRVDGFLLPCEITLLRTEHEGNLQIVAYFHDLSEIKRAMGQAREADKRAMLMLDSTPLACFLLREDVTAIDCNQAAVEFFGFADKAEALERYKEIYPSVTEDGKPNAPPADLTWFRGRESVRFEYTHINLKGEYIPCEIFITNLEYRGETVIASYIRDLREIKAMIDEMKRIEVAEEESRAKSQFLARMSHEIRTPMNSIMGVTDIQLLKGGHSHEIEEAFLQIRSSSNVLLALINDILDLSKVEAGKMELVIRPYEVASLIFDTVQINQMHMGSKDIKFTLEIDESIPSILIGDELRIKQILNNLLSNAFKYTDEGEVKAKIGIEWEENNAFLVIAISDTGQGMTRDQLNMLFSSEYVRFNEVSNHLIVGTGLGMNIANNFIRLMGGTISAESEQNKGTTFYVKIPQKVETNSRIGKEIVENLQNFQSSHRAFHKRYNFEYEHMPYGKILVVDDVESNLFVAKGLMTPYGLTVETAVSGFEAIEKVKAGNVYDIIFMDHMMPDMDGIEAAKIIFETGYDRPIIALTANTIMGQADLFMNSGFAGFISKPIDVSILNAYLIKYVHDIYPEDVRRAAREAVPIEKVVSASIMDSFLRDAERAVGVLDALLEKHSWEGDDYKLYTINTHGMKSALANINRDRLSQEAGSLETAGRTGDDNYIRARTPKFLEDLREVIDRLGAAEPVSYTVDEDTVLLREKLFEIKKACDIYYKKAARGALEELNKHKWTKGTKAFLGEIAAHLLHSEFEEVSEKINAWGEVNK